jgi:signal transduction histidine kinase
MASLRVIRGPDAEKIYSLTDEPVRLGRDPACGIHLNDSEVSRDHALLQRRGPQFTIVDLKSSNGTFVNERRIEQCVLAHGDRLRVGKSMLTFTEESEPPSSYGKHDVEIVVPVHDSDLSEIRQSLSLEATSPKSTMSPLQVAASDSAVRREQSHWEIMYRTALMVSRTLDINQLLDQILDLIFNWVGCDRGCVMLIEESTGRLLPACRKNRDESKPSDPMEISQTILDYSIQKQQGVMTSNAVEDQRWDAAASIIHLGIREAICVPLQGRYGVVGAIYIDTSISQGEYAQRGKKNQFKEEHLQLMVAIGHQAALAIEDTFFYRGMLQSERLAVMGQTIARLSHHIKNIVQGIRGGSYLVDDGLARGNLETVAKGWRIVEKNQERISSLVMDMLSFSKERRAELVSEDLRSTVDDVVELMQSRADDAKVKLVWNRPADAPDVSFDPEAMHRAILNVVGNAIDAAQSTAEGIVTIQMDCSKLPDLISLVVADNGPGIEPDDLPRIFSLFESTKGSRGTGLGLPVSQKVLREHGGDIHVSTQQGKGATFRLQWPSKSEPCGLGQFPDRPTSSE